MSLALLVWLLGVISLHVYSPLVLRRHWPALLAHAVPTAVFALIVRVFLVGGSSAVRQLAGDGRSWSLWAELWPLLLLGSLGAAIAHVIAIIVLLVRRRGPEWLPVPIVGAMLSGNALFALAHLAPSV